MLTRRIEARPVETAAEFTVIRDGEELALSIMMEATPSSVGESRSAESEILEFTVRDPIFMDAIDRRWGDAMQGVVVTNVVSGGWASLGGLQQGDLVISMNDRSITDVETFETELRRLAEEGPRVVKVFVRRDHRTNFVFIEPEWPEKDAA